jgi:hypothetical protein
VDDSRLANASPARLCITAVTLYGGLQSSLPV